jgi:hypothetical protein
LALKELVLTDDIYIASGTRLHPPYSGCSQWELNTFPIFWGWGSNSQKWKYLSAQMKQPLPSIKRYPNPILIRSFYWRAGSRRVREGFVDTWDTIISEIFYRFNLFNLSPVSSLVRNVGDDEHATHEMSSLANLPDATEQFEPPSGKPLFSRNNNDFCGKFLYNYRLRHIFTTSFTKILDRTIFSRKRRNPFSTRLSASKVFYSEELPSK